MASVPPLPPLAGSPPTRLKVFISHATADRDLVERAVLAPLREHGVATWYAKDDIQTAAEWEASIRHGLESCDWFLVVMTPRSAASRWVAREVHWAVEERPDRIVPVLLEPCDLHGWHLGLRPIQYVDFTREPEVGVGRLLAVWGLAAGPTDAAAESTPDDGLPRTLAAVRGRWQAEGPAAGLAVAETLADGADAAWLVELLRFLRDKAEPASAPLVFRLLAHPAEDVRRRAQAALQAIGWDRAAEAALACGRDADPARQGWLLDGLSALEAHADGVALLDRLTHLLQGDLRNRAILLHERKRLALTLEATAALFREHHSPYRLVRVLGQGLHAAAYLARHDDAESDVVVRVLLPEYVARPRVRAAFLDLGRRAFQWVHQGLVRTVDTRALPERGLYYTVRDYVEAPTLQKLRDQGRRFGQAEVIAVARQALDALTPAHRQGLAHGGVKPSNLFLFPDGRLVVGDPSLPVPGEGDRDRLAYDYRYAAPETFRGGDLPGPAADLYALGCVAHELLRGAPPFVSDSPFELAGMHLRDAVPRLPSAVAAVEGERFLVRLLTKEAAGRFASLAEAQAALTTWALALADGSGDDAPPPPVRPGPPPRPATYATLNSIVAADLSEMFPSVVAPADPPTMHTEAEGAASVDVRPREEAGSPEIPGYRILDVLGRGGMGVVYRAVQLKADRVVALKMLRAGADAVSAEADRFRTEAQAIARLHHPGIVQVYEVGEHHGVAFIALEYVGGGSLAERLRQAALPPAVAAALVGDLAAAVRHAHERGVVHRDLKPSNVLLSEDDVPKIADFGLAKKLDDVGMTLSGAILGTPSYMAPEQAHGGRNPGPSVDIYGLGAILYECLTGRPPFRAATPMETLIQVTQTEVVPVRQLAPAVPRDLEVICLKCLAKDPGRRYASAADLADDLRRFLDAEPITARPVGWVERAGRWVSRNPALTAALAAAAALLATTIGVTVWALQMAGR